MATILIEQGDITTYEADAIVNAANNDLILGGGLAGAIRRRGGPSIQEECNHHGAIQVGEAAMTGAGKLPSQYVIHAAGMQLGGRTTAESLASAIRCSLRLAEEKGIKSIAFPAVGAGIGGFDKRRCAEIMLRAVQSHLTAGSCIETVYFVLFDAATTEIFQSVYSGPG